MSMSEWKEYTLGELTTDGKGNLWYCCLCC